MAQITVLGCGRWASFQAWYQVKKLGNQVMLWGRAGDPIYEQLRVSKKNAYLSMPAAVQYTSDLAEAINYATTIIIAIAAQAMQEFSLALKKCYPQNKTFVLCMKGIDQNTGERLSQILRKNIPDSNKICVLVGPGHVQDLTAGQPNVMIMAGDDADTVRRVSRNFESPLISILQSDDLIGVEVGAAAKNVMGIAAGFLDGLGCSSLKGALMARGCYEVSQLIEKMGGERMTAFGMSHLGDFEATIFSHNSHNRRYGEEFIKGTLLSANIGTAEGVATTQALYNLSRQLGVVMPIVNTVYGVLYQNQPQESIIQNLFQVTSRQEFFYE